MPWQLTEQLPLDQVPVTALAFQVPPNRTSFAPFTWRSGSVPAWQYAQEMFFPVTCLGCSPELGGLPWQDAHVTCAPLDQLIVAFAPPAKLPWQYVEAQLALVAVLRV